MGVCVCARARMWMARVLTRLHSGTAAAVCLSLSPHSPAHSPTHSVCLKRALALVLLVSLSPFHSPSPFVVSVFACSSSLMLSIDQSKSGSLSLVRTRINTLSCPLLNSGLCSLCFQDFKMSSHVSVRRPEALCAASRSTCVRARVTGWQASASG